MRDIAVGRSDEEPVVAGVDEVAGGVGISHHDEQAALRAVRVASRSNDRSVQRLNAPAPDAGEAVLL